MKYLTEQQIKKYQDDGFLLIKNFFSEDELETINKSIVKFSKNKPNDWELGKEMAYYETSTTNGDYTMNEPKNIWCVVESEKYGLNFFSVTCNKESNHCSGDHGF